MLDKLPEHEIIGIAPSLDRLADSMQGLAQTMEQLARSMQNIANLGHRVLDNITEYEGKDD